MEIRAWKLKNELENKKKSQKTTKSASRKKRQSTEVEYLFFQKKMHTISHKDLVFNSESDKYERESKTPQD